MKIAGTHYFCVFIAWQLVGACQAILWNGKGLHLGVRSGPSLHSGRRDKAIVGRKDLFVAAVRAII